MGCSTIVICCFVVKQSEGESLLDTVSPREERRPASSINFGEYSHTYLLVWCSAVPLPWVLLDAMRNLMVRPVSVPASCTR